MIKLIFTAASLLAAQAALASSLSFRIDFQNAMTQKSERVPVNVHLPKVHSDAKPFVIYISGCNGSPTDGAATVIKSLVDNGIAVAELKSFGIWGRFYDACKVHTGLTGQQRAEETYRVRDELVKRGLAREDNVGLFGNSHGGWTITHAMFLDGTPNYNTASTKPFAAAVGWYPWCQTNDSPTFVNKTPTLLLGGSADTWTHWSRCRQLNRVVQATDGQLAPLELHLYDGATHSWDSQRETRTFDSNQGQVVLAYDAAVTADSIARTLAWFNTHLRK